MFNFEDIFEESYVGEDEFAVTDEEMNAIGVIECFDEPEVACYRIALENEQNHNAIMSALMQKEFEVLESTGQAMVWEAVDLKAAWNWVKKQISKFWEKVKGVFKKVMDKINSMVLTNKAFAKKYRGKESQYTIDDAKAATITGYNFPENQMLPYSSVANAVKKQKANFDGTNAIKAKDNFAKEARQALVGGTGEADKFNDDLKAKLYGDVNTKSVKITQSFSSLLDYIETYGSEKKSAKAAYKEAESAVKALLSEAKKAERETEEAEKRYKAFSACTTVAINVMSTGLSMQTKAITAKMIQARKMANMFVTGKAEVKESADIMEGVVII